MIAHHLPAPQEPEIKGLPAPGPRFGWPTLPVNQGALRVYLAACVRRGVAYGLGAKADGGGRSLFAFPPQYPAIDCSGWVRAALAFSASCVLPDGSVNQHEWVDSHAFKVSSYSALLRRDGALRIAFIAPNWRHRIGHVYLVRDGKTMESWGGHGPGSRSPLAHVLHALTTNVYVLTAPAEV